jgi:hypothetical protein
MILTVEENMHICDWLLERGIGLGECACMLGDMECGDTFALALLKVFLARRKKMEAIDEEFNVPDWANPITP